MERNAIDVLEDEHRELQTLFARVTSPDEDRREVLKELVQTLSAHVTTEKELLVPVVKERSADGDAQAEQLSQFHDEVGKILVHLERRKVNSPDVPDMVTELIDLTDRHVAEADETVLPGMRQAMSDAELSELGAAMTSEERQLLTHPHPHLPDSGPLAKVGKWAASVVDKRRDESTDIGRSAT